ncbi:MAG: L,D-transpeptidase family protein [Akkermansia sp.]|nr:L,D-transpeptidase family protein [Akkermansia sp.]MBQ2814237.1 L,D-transpeptidase family protein [Akkermansia sp.]
MKHTKFTLCLTSLLVLAACTPVPQPERPQVQTIPQQVIFVPQAAVNPLDLPNKNAPGYQNPYPQGTYEHFVAKPAYPKTMETYSDDVLLNQLTVSNSKIIICIPQQRARLYVEGRVALDWPVSTGTKGHETPTGVFRVIEKDKNHKSNRYGKFVNSQGKTIDSNADLSKGLPEGSTFQAAGMPNWHRLTWDGVGIHGGKVIAGQRLSHGCIRTPYPVAAKLFEHSEFGMPVYISRAVEDYNRGGHVRPIDVKYRQTPGNDYTDLAPSQIRTIPAPATPAAAAQQA